MLESLLDHWPEYLMEALALGIFMVSACLFTAIFEHHASPLNALIPKDVYRRIFIGLAMGLTAIGLIYSPMGKRSGAHMNPAVTLTFYRLGKIKGFDAIFYGIFQTLGGYLGVLLTVVLLHSWMADPSVNYAVTIPGPTGTTVAFAAETAISFGLMGVVLLFINNPHLARWTGVAAGILIAIYVTLEAPLSGMSMNPSRTLASAANAGNYSSLWLYFVAPPFGMLLAAEVYVRLKGVGQTFCAKLYHDTPQRCIFCHHLDEIHA